MGILMKDTCQGEDDFCIADQHDEKRNEEKAAERKQVVKGLMPPLWKTAVGYTLRENFRLPSAIC